MVAEFMGFLIRNLLQTGSHQWHRVGLASQARQRVMKIRVGKQLHHAGRYVLTHIRGCRCDLLEEVCPPFNDGEYVFQIMAGVYIIAAPWPAPCRSANSNSD